MLATYFFFAGILAISFVVLQLARIWWHQKFSRLFRAVNQIPGPPPLPIIGNLFDIMGSQENLFEMTRRDATTYFPIYKWTVLNSVVVNLLSPEDVELVLSSSKFTQKSRMYALLRPWLGTGLLTSSGNKWQTRRKILTPAFHFGILQSFVSVFNESALKLVEELYKSANEPFIDVMPPVTEFALDSILETSMGIKLGSKCADYRKAVHDFGKIATYRLSRPWLDNRKVFKCTAAGKFLRKVVGILHGFSTGVINERKMSLRNAASIGNKRMAMLDLMLTAQGNGANIDDEGIREEVDTFMFEGHDTTTMAISLILLVLANHPDVQEGIRQEIIEVLGTNATLPTYQDLQQLPYTERCLKECLRLYPSVPLIARKASEDLQTTTGYTIPKNAMIHIPIFHIHRNPAVFPRPEVFDPDRFLPENVQKRHPFAYIPFSAGPRNCIGQRFAMLELKAVLCAVLRAFQLVAVDRMGDEVFVADLILRTQHGIKIKFVARSDVNNT